MFIGYLGSNLLQIFYLFYHLHIGMVTFREDYRNVTVLTLLLHDPYTKWPVSSQVFFDDHCPPCFYSLEMFLE